MLKNSTLRKFIIPILLISIGACSLLYSFAIIFYGVTFYMFFIIAGVLFILAGIFMISIRERHKKLIPEYLMKVVKLSVLIVIFSFIIIESFIIYHGSKEDSYEVDYLVVLGAGLWGDTPSLTLRQRLDESIEFLRDNPNMKVVLSGGRGAGETITEAEAMKRYLVQKGISEEFIIKEDKSTNTKENLKFTSEILRNLDNKDKIKIKIITTNFHMFRSKLLARINGFIAYGRPAPIHPLLIPAYYIREYMAVIKTLIFDLI